MYASKQAIMHSYQSSGVTIILKVQTDNIILLSNMKTN